MPMGPRPAVPPVTTVDARGLACPLPLTMAKRRMRELRLGETLVVLATDREAPIDLGAWAAADGHAIETVEREGWTEFRLVKDGGRPAT
jgi:tRNA 2-thiouridine synthesizing protein A